MDDARVHLPGALDEAIKHSLFAALDEFFRFSEVWQEEISVAVNTSDTLYDVEPEEVPSAKFVRLIEVKNRDDLTVYAEFREIGVLDFVDRRTVAETMTARFVNTVGDPVTGSTSPNPEMPVFPDWILARYREGFLSGTLGKMMLQPAKVYSNQTLATYHLRRFENTKSQGKIDSKTRNISGAQAWRFPRGWR